MKQTAGRPLPGVLIVLVLLLLSLLSLPLSSVVEGTRVSSSRLSLSFQFTLEENLAVAIKVNNAFTLKKLKKKMFTHF